MKLSPMCYSRAGFLRYPGLSNMRRGFRKFIRCCTCSCEHLPRPTKRVWPIRSPHFEFANQFCRSGCLLCGICTLMPACRQFCCTPESAVALPRRPKTMAPGMRYPTSCFTFTRKHNVYIQYLICCWVISAEIAQYIAEWKILLFRHVRRN